MGSGYRRASKLKRFLALAAALVPIAVAPLTATATDRSTSQVTGSQVTGDITISADPDELVFEQPTTVRGKVRGTLKSNVPIILQENPAPYDQGFKQAATSTTDTNGDYQFTGVRPELNTRYRTTTAVPQGASAEVQVTVAMKVVLRVSDLTPRRGQRVRFSGTVAPEHDGRLVHIQLRRFGRWRTIALTALRDSGTEFSKFRKRVRVRRNGPYRARVFQDRDHTRGTSRARRLFIGG